MPEPIEVIELNGQPATWNMSLRLGTLRRPVRKTHRDKKAVEALMSNPDLIDSLLSMILEETSEMASIAWKDGSFGILFEHTHDCSEAQIESFRIIAPRKRVVRRTLADINGEIEACGYHLDGVSFGIPDPSIMSHKKVVVWAFLPSETLARQEWDHELVDQIVSLLTE